MLTSPSPIIKCLEDMPFLDELPLSSRFVRTVHMSYRMLELLGAL